MSRLKTQSQTALWDALPLNPREAGMRSASCTKPMIGSACCPASRHWALWRWRMPLCQTALKIEPESDRNIAPPET